MCVCMHAHVHACVHVRTSKYCVVYFKHKHFYFYVSVIPQAGGRGEGKESPRSFQTQVAKPEAELALKLVAMGNILQSSPQVLGLCVLCYPWASQPEASEQGPQAYSRGQSVFKEALIQHC